MSYAHYENWEDVQAELLEKDFYTVSLKHIRTGEFSVIECGGVPILFDTLKEADAFGRMALGKDHHVDAEARVDVAAVNANGLPDGEIIVEDAPRP